jgi:transcriptional regulator with XRE-family HTH domain
LAHPAPPQPKRSALPGNGGSHSNDKTDGPGDETAILIDLRVARRIRASRLRSGMTLQKLAQEIGVAFQQAHKYERGQSRISAGRLFHIAKTLDTPITYFFLSDDEARALESRPAKEAAINFPAPSLSGQTEGPAPESSGGKLGASRLNGLGLVGDRRGATTALFAVLLTLFFGFAGLGGDFGTWYTLKRQYQSAAANGGISGPIALPAAKGNFDGIGLPVGPATTDLQNIAMYTAGDNLPVNVANSLLVDGRRSSTLLNGGTTRVHTGSAKFVSLAE